MTQYEDNKFFWTLEMIYHTFFLCIGMYSIQMFSFIEESYKWMIFAFAFLCLAQGFKMYSIIPDFKLKDIEGD